MKAWVLPKPGPVDTNPLELRELPVPEPGEREVLMRISACGICRTDLHVVEGELPPRKPNPVPGHQVVGTIERTGPRVTKYAPGARAGIAWLHKTCGKCAYCRSGRENLCDFPDFTGYTVDGGYAQYAVAREDFIYPIPEGFPDLQAAPLLCAGIIGFRCLRVSGIAAGDGLGAHNLDRGAASGLRL